MVWLHQVQARVKLLTSRLQDVLGETWAKTPVGAKLDEQARLVTKRAEIQPLVDAWTASVQAALQHPPSRKLFTVQQGKLQGWCWARKAGTQATLR
jgi:hypothetical protein